MAWVKRLVVLMTLASVGCGSDSGQEATGTGTGSEKVGGASEQSRLAFDGSVHVINELKNGESLIAGDFSEYNGGRLAGGLIRLQASGEPDTDFQTNLGSGFDGKVKSLLHLQDGSIIVGGSFGTANGQAAAHIAKINSDGSVDTDFLTNLGTGFNGDVNSLLLNSTGQILVTGNFTRFNGKDSRRYKVLNTDGTEGVVP